MATDLKVGERVCVKELHPVQVHDPTMTRYLGKAGVTERELPPEWDFPRMLRVVFDDTTLDPLAFFGKELERV